MSSKNFSLPEHIHMFKWSKSLAIENYFFATYVVSSYFPGEQTAIAMALEQSTATVYIKNYVEPATLVDWSIRVYNVEELHLDTPTRAVTPYYLPTEAYGGEKTLSLHKYSITLAFPTRLVGNKPTQLFNIILGELPRLGFLTSFALIDVELPPSFGCGPSFGTKGILELLGKNSGPLLCRSTRPGIGLSTETSAQLNRDVLVGGFHMVKDDELLFFNTTEDFTNHIKRMLKARDEAIAFTGEKKLYVANLLCEADELFERWEIATNLGVDAVLVSPYTQGFSTLLALAKQRKIPLLAHNACGELSTRNPDWCVSDKVSCKILRALGADWIVTPGPFGESEAESDKDFIHTLKNPQQNFQSVMPILQGGKNPEDLHSYVAAVNHKNFMLIVASWVDGHPLGLIEGAKIFRSAIDSLEP